MVQTTMRAVEKHDTLPWGCVECPALSHRGSSCRTKWFSHTECKDPVYVQAALPSAHPRCCGGQSLRPSEFTAVSTGVTWEGGVCTLTEHELPHGQLVQRACIKQLLTVDLHSLQPFPGVRWQLLLQTQPTAHMWETSGHGGKEAQHAGPESGALKALPNLPQAFLLGLDPSP